MVTIRSNEQRDELVGRTAVVGVEVDGRKFYTYDYKYAASAKKALDRLVTAGVDAKIVEANAQAA